MSDREAQVIITANNSQYNKSIEDSQKATDKLVKSLEKTSDTLTKINKATAKGLLKIGAAEIAGITALSAVAARLEKQTSNIQANLALNNASSQFNAVTASIRQMSREMPLARAEIAQMATAVSDMGMTTAKQIGGVSSTFSKMGMVTGESSAGLAQSMVQFQRSMGVAQPTYQTMDPYANSVTALSARAGTSAQSILQFAQSFSPAARVAGLEQSSVLGISTAATRAGVDASYAASTISQILNDITALRYTQSPELGRYARALGVDSSELTRKTTSPEDQDRFMRNIISRVVSVAQTEEGPSRLSMLGYDGLRARKALQGLAAEPGGIDKWINYTRYQMTQPNIETAFKESTRGLTDQLEMLRNRGTDIGQNIGAPTAEALAFLARGANAAADALDPFTEAVTGFIGKIGIPLGTLTLVAGGLLKLWSTFSAVAYGTRAGWNVGTSAFAGGLTDTRGVMRGTVVGPDDLSVWGQRISDPDKAKNMTRTQRGAWRAGSFFGGLTSDWNKPTGVGQFFLQGVDRSRQWAERTTLDFYEKAKLEPVERTDLRVRQNEIVEQYKNDLKRYRDELSEVARRNAAAASYGTAGASYAMPAPERPRVPVSPITRLPLAYIDPESGRYSAGGVAAGAVGTWARVPMAAAGTTGSLGWRMTKGLGHHLFVDPWQQMRVNQQQMGMGAWTSEKFGGAARGIGSGLSAVAGNEMVQFAAIMALAGWAKNQRDSYGEWNNRFGKDVGGGLSDTELDNLNEYNEKLGLATRSLNQFKKALDESNPARSDNINAELRDNSNVREYGRTMDEIVNKRLESIKTLEQAQQWISSQGTMNADQWVLVMRDFSKVFKNNQDIFNQLNQWVINNQKNGRVDVSVAPPTDRLGQLYNEKSTDVPLLTQLTRWTVGGPTNPFLQFATGGDIDDVRKRTQTQLELVIGSTAARAKTVGETKDASSLFGNKGRLNEDQQDTLSRAEAISQVMKKIVADEKEINNLQNPLEYEKKMNRVKALEQYVQAASKEFGIDFNALNVGSGGMALPLSSYDIEAGQSKIKEVLTESAKYDPAIKSLIDNGLLDKVVSGSSISEGLPDLTVQTSSQQAVAGTAFANASATVFEKYLGEGSMLGKGLLAAGTLSDTTNFEYASKQLVEFAKRIDSDRQTQLAKGAQRGESGAFWAIAGQPTSDLNRQYALVEQMKINNPEGTQGWEIAKAAQAKIAKEIEFNQSGMNALELQRDNLDLTKGLTSQLRVDPTQQSPDLMRQLGERKAAAEGTKMSFIQTALQWGVSREREERDWQISIGRQEDAYLLQRKYANDDFYRARQRSKDAFNRQFQYSEAAFYRTLKYQQQDFYRSRQREEEAYQRQRKYAAEDTAKAIGDPYNRMDLQMLSDPANLLVNMGNRLERVAQQNQNLQTLRDRGLSQEAINQMDLSNFSNAQQVQHLVNTASSSDIQQFNDVVKQLIAQGGQLNQNDTATRRADEERNIALKQALDDFLRNLKRTKIEHAIQVKFSKKEFDISMKDSEKEHQISLKRAADAYDLMMKNAAADRQKNLEDQTEDLFGFANKGLDSLDKVMKKIIGKGGYIDLYGGNLKTELKGLVNTTDTIIKEIEEAIKKIGEAREEAERDEKKRQQQYETDREDRRATRSYPQGRGGGSAVYRAMADPDNTTGHCLSTVSEWLGVKGIKSLPDANAAWAASKDKHPGSKKVPAGKPVYWAGGAHGHVALSLGGDVVRSTDWPRSGRVGTTTIDTITKAWNKTYRGWAGDAWGIKLAEGGILPAKPGGHRAVMAEAGSAEMAVPLNSRGIDFMAQFTKGVAAYMVKTMPKTPVSPQHIVNNYDHSQNVRIDGMVVESNDPRKFLREIQKEAQKKRAALYKS